VPTIAQPQPTAAPTSAPTLGDCGVQPASAFFRVTNAVPTMTCNGPTTEAQGTCFTTLDESCVTDGPGNYGNNERCTISVLQDSFLYVSGNFNVEGGTGCSTGGSNCFDYLTINGSYPAVPALITSAAFEGLFVFAGTTIGWVSDNSILRDGWTLCASVRAHATFSHPRMSLVIT
jgi:hypothetical protein